MGHTTTLTRASEQPVARLALSANSLGHLKMHLVTHGQTSTPLHAHKHTYVST